MSADMRHRQVHPMVALLALVLCAALAILIASSPSRGDSPSPESATLSVHLGGMEEPETLNPVTSYSYMTWQIWHLNYDTLVGTDPKDMSPRPELATDWSVSPDNLQWTFNLRKGVTWQDGTPFTAADVIFTIDYLKAMGPIQWAPQVESITSVTAPDDYTVLVTTSDPKANMLRLWPPILPEHIWSKVPPEKAASTYNPKPPFIGTGPFQLESFKKGSYYRLVKNPDYWQAGKPTVDEIVWVPYTNADTMAMDLQGGSLDYAIGLPIGQFKKLTSAQGITANAGFYRNFDEITLNCSTSPLSKGNPVLRDEKFRQALSWAVDRERLVEVACNGEAQVAQGIITPDVPAYYWTPPAGEAYGFDLQKADELLTAAGYRLQDGVRLDKQGKPIRLRLMAPSAYPRNVSEGKLVAGWFEQLGLQVQYEVVDEGALTAAVFSFTEAGEPAPDFDMYIWYWGQTSDPNFILYVHMTDQIGAWNDAYWSNADYDALYPQQAQELDPVKRKALTDQMVKIFHESAPYIVLTYPKELEAFNTTKWTGWTQVPEGLGLYGYYYDNVDTYINLEPATASETTADSGSSTVWIVLAVIVGVVVAAGAWLLVRRSGRRSEEA